jgi:hypothetical protein
MANRSIEDRLREQYFDLLPSLAKAAESFKTHLQYSLLDVARSLTAYENMQVKVRVKDCASSIDKLRQINPMDPTARRNPGAVFDRDMPEKYDLLLLRDLVGARILVFPSVRAGEVDGILRAKYPDWMADPIGDGDQQLALKYNGHSEESAGLRVPCEYQIVSTLIGLFWEVEHAAIYKQTPQFKGLTDLMQNQRLAVYKALKAFEDEFELQINRSEESDPFSPL